MRPPFLCAGDAVGLIAPGRRADESILARATELYTRWGLRVVSSTNLMANEHPYHGAGAETKRSDFQRFLDDDSIRAIICLRGGYGTTTFLDSLNWDKFKHSPKWIVGFSDVTALHLQLNRLQVESIHGAMPIQFADSAQQIAIGQQHDLLFGKLEPLIWTSGPQSAQGTATGTLIGGNLSMIVDSLATSNEIHTFGQILFIEEVEEPLYKIDRMLTQLKRARKLDKIKGMIVGHFTGITDTSLPFGVALETIIKSKLPAFVPIAFGCPSGHDAPNFSWIHGTPIQLQVGSERATIEYLATTI